MPDQRPVAVSGAVEGIVDEAILKRLINDVGAVVGPVHGRRGKTHLRERLSGYNQAARREPWFVLVDLNSDYLCAPDLLAAWLPSPAQHMLLRIAIREIEAWLLADGDSMAEFLNVSPSRLPSDADALPDPKAWLVNLARRSRRRDIRDGLVPRPGSGRSVGPTYSSQMIHFVQSRWRPHVAERASDSLRRCRERLSQLVDS